MDENEILKVQLKQSHRSNQIAMFVAIVTAVALIISLYFNVVDRIESDRRQIINPTWFHDGATFNLSNGVLATVSINKFEPWLIITADNFREDIQFGIDGIHKHVSINGTTYDIQLIENDPYNKRYQFMAYIFE